MRKYLKTTLIAACLLFNMPIIGSNPATWDVYFENDTIKIEFAYQNCDFSSTSSQEIIILKFTNLSAAKITLAYETEIWYNDKKINTKVNEEEFRKTIELNQNQTITANCDNQWREYTLFSAFISNENNEKHVSLTKFELTNITTSND